MRDKSGASEHRAKSGMPATAACFEGVGSVSGRVDFSQVRDRFTDLQEQISQAVEDLEGSPLREDVWERGQNEGGGRSRVLAHGVVFEQAGINFSHVHGDALPASATAKRAQLHGCSYEALGVSVVMHPQNPYVPTSHCNIRFIVATRAHRKPLWWFGGGFDLTPFYGFEEDVRQWHRTARDACAPFGSEVYPRYKSWCDEYFYLNHRGEPRGVGGLFFDDLHEWGFERCLDFTLGVGKHYVLAYQPIVRRRMDLPYGERERQFQLYRRGRYVEFNLIYDRGTLFGLQSGGRTESILMSLPPAVRWQYDWKPEPGSPEAELYEVFLKPRDWVE